MSSKVAFRARNLDANRALPILRDHELPPEFVENGATSAPRITQQEITTGMEKEEETEHHLQQALTAQQVYKSAEQQAIPVPEITENTEENHRRIYRRPFKLPKSLINYQAYMFESDEPVYDADEKDLVWLSDTYTSHAEQLDVASFERMIQRLEEGSSAQRLVTLEEAHLLLKNAADELLIAAVYQQWHEKRVGCESLVPVVLTEKRDGSNNNNPYVAFRRRKEKMQTRKNRKNDELSYERMLKLRLNLSKASLLLELIKRREEAKRELCSLVGNVFERRYAAGDFSATAMREAELTMAKLRNAMALPSPSPLAATSFIKFTAVARSPSACAALQSLADRHAISHKRRAALGGFDEQFATRRASRRAAALPADIEDLLLAHKRRRVMPRPPPIATVALPCASAPTLPPAEHNMLLDSHKPGWRHEDVQTAANIDCEFAFRRKAGCRYAAPANRRDHGPRPRRFSLVCLPPRHSYASFWRLCYARRRVARSHRVVLDLDKRSCSLRIPVSAIDCSPVENGVHVTSTPVSVSVPVWRSVLAAAQHALCAYCDPATRQCSRKRTLCTQSRLDAQPHLDDLDALVQLQEARPNVYLPRCAALCDPEPRGALTRPADSTGLLELVRLYLDDSSPQLPPVHSVANGTSRPADAPSRRPNGVNGAHDRSCVTQPLPHLNGNNNNDAGRLTTPSRLPSIGKRLTDSLGGLLGGIAPIPLAPLENGKSPSPTGSQPSAADSESDAEALISEQVRTHTPIST